ncbi:MAG: phosphoserine phosphatase SerB [Myxococcota bacterium]
MAKVLVTVTGRDAPGITAALTQVVAEQGVILRDVEQVVVHGQLTLCLLLETSSDAFVLKELLFAASQRGLTLQLAEMRDEAPSRSQRRVAVTALGNPLEARHLSALAKVLAEHGANIVAMDRLSGEALDALEVRADVTGDGDVAALSSALLGLALTDDLDLAVQPWGLVRRGMRLCAMDMDSTLVQVEVIDELARHHGVGEQVARITADAMAGGLDYEASLRRRVALLEGLRADAVDQVADQLPLTDGAEVLVSTLKHLGYKTAVISGGFDVAARRVQARLGLDHACSNTLEVKDGVLTGRVLEPIVTPERKVQLLERIARDEGVDLSQTIAIGDGANDLKMIERAGLGIAFHAKATLRDAADTALTAGGLDRVLYLLGIRARDLAEWGIPS